MSAVSKEGVQDIRPGREAVSGVQIDSGRRPARQGGEQPMVGEATFRSYYGQPIINKPVWEAPDIPGYLFLGGLAGASSVVAAGAQLTGRRSLSRALKVTSTAAIGMSGLALVHDLGRPARFLNMLRVFKPTSPMSVGSWLLAGYAPFSAAASLSALTGRLELAGNAAALVAGTLGTGVATYTAALVSDTAVPAWHDAYKDMPFVFAASAMSAAAGAGLVAAPLEETGPVHKLGIASGIAELLLMKSMKRRLGSVGEAYDESARAHRYERGAQLATSAGVASLALMGRRSRLASAFGGAGLLLGSALARFAIFEAGLASAENPRHTVEPQRRRIQEREQNHD